MALELSSGSLGILEGESMVLLWSQYPGTFAKSDVGWCTGEEARCRLDPSLRGREDL